MPAPTFDVALHEAVLQWRARRTPLSPETEAVYVRNLRRLARELRLVGPLPDYDTMVKILNHWRRKDQRRLEQREISRSKIRGDWNAFATFFGALPAVYPKNPIHEVLSISLEKALPRPLTDPGQLQRLFQQPDVTDLDGLRDRCLLELWLHALRRIEVCRLSLGDVQFNGHTFHLRVQGKGDRPRLIPLRVDTAKRLAEYIRRSLGYDTGSLDEAAFMAGVNAERALFLHRGRRLPGREANRIFAKLRERAGLSDRLNGSPLGPHVLRHTALTALLNANVDLRRVQEIAGHSDIRQTQLYTAVTTDAMEHAMNALPMPVTEDGR